MTKRRKQVRWMKFCAKCEKNLVIEGNFLPSNSPFFPDGHIDVCNNCLSQVINYADLAEVDLFCRYADYPFLVDEYTKLMNIHEEDTLKEYGKLFYDVNYRALDWKGMNEKLNIKMNRGMIDLDIPMLRPDKVAELRQKWGNYSDDELVWLENYYLDMHMSYDIKTASHRDYLRKICKLSLLIDKSIDEGGDIKKLTDTYDKLMKSADFTQANSKEQGAITSVCELVDILEREGWNPKFWDRIPRDEVDETILNVQEFNRRLIENDPGLHDLIEATIRMQEEKEQNPDKSDSEIKRKVMMSEMEPLDEEEDTGDITEKEFEELLFPKLGDYNE